MLIKKYFKNLKKEFQNHKFTGLSFGTNDVQKGFIFFCIKGNKVDGKKFISKAIKNGAKTIISDLKFEGYKNDVLFLKSRDTRELLSKIASKIYNKKPKNLIAVTGTNGKSSIADFFFQILKLNNKRVASIGTLGVNSKIIKLKTINTTLDALNLHKILEKLKNRKVENVILEASSHGLKQKRLNNIRFKMGIFTNLSRDHLDYHKTYNDYLNSKLILFNKLLKKNSIVIYDNEIQQSKILKNIAKKKNLKTSIIGKNECDFSITGHNFFGNKQQVKFLHKRKEFYFETDLIGRLQINNLMMAIIAAYKSGIPMTQVIKSIRKIKSVNGRLQQIGNLKNNAKVILDYAHTPDALRKSLESIKDQFKLRKIYVVFGCGGERDKKKRQIMGKIANDFCDRIYLTDDNPRREDPKQIRKEIKKKINKSKLFEIPSRKKAIIKAIKDLKSGDILLVAGKGHENYQEYYKRKFFSDKICILKQLKIKNKNLFNDWKLNILKDQIQLSNFNKNLKINTASINSKIINKNDIFFAIKGKNKDGNKYADEALKKRASLAIVDRRTEKYKSKKIKVKNTLKFLTETSAKIRILSKANIIAITGSSGKTSLKELLGQSLNKMFPTFYSIKSFNNRYGVPISLFNIAKKDKYGVFEVGMNKRDEINQLTKIIKPNLGIITNISYAHIKNFKNLSQIASAKSEILNHIVEGGTIILNADDKYFSFLKKIAIFKKLKIISFGLKNKHANICFKKLLKFKSDYLLTINVNSIKKVFIINKELKPYIYNILAATSTISNFVDINQINKKIFYDFKPPKGRGDISKINVRNKNIYLIDESYNSNPSSLEFAIKNFDSLKIKSKYKNLLLGDMLELGKFSKKLHIKMSEIINNSGINKLYVYGNHIKETFNKIKTQKKGRILKNSKDIYKLIKNDLKDKDYLMIKGSNSTGLNQATSKIKTGNFNAL